MHFVIKFDLKSVLMFSRLNLYFFCKILAKVVRVCIGKLNYATQKCIQNDFKIIIFETYLLVQW
jgi:uncharacterized membrane protein